MQNSQMILESVHFINNSFSIVWSRRINIEIEWINQNLICQIMDNIDIVDVSDFLERVHHDVQWDILKIEYFISWGINLEGLAKDSRYSENIHSPFD
jgi:hypothetical protein